MADRHRLSVTLPDDLAEQVRAKVASGQHASERSGASLDEVRESLAATRRRLEAAARE